MSNDLNKQVAEEVMKHRVCCDARCHAERASLRTQLAEKDERISELCTIEESLEGDIFDLQARVSLLVRLVKNVSGDLSHHREAEDIATRPLTPETEGRNDANNPQR